MPKIHLKGFVLQAIGRYPLWEDEIFEKVGCYYGVEGRYWAGAVRLTLADLYAGGLLEEVESSVIPDSERVGTSRITVRYGLSPFGRSRMEKSGLLVDVE